MDTSKMNRGLLDALTERGWESDEIRSMSADKAFDEYCMWHGLIDWGPTLRKVYENAKASAS